MKQQYVTARAIAVVLGCQSNTVLDWVRRGELSVKTIKVGKSLRFDLAETAEALKVQPSALLEAQSRPE